MTSHSSIDELVERIDSLEAKIDALTQILKGPEYQSIVPAYSIRQVALEVGCSPYILKKVYTLCSLGKSKVPPPHRGTRYSKQDISLFREAYARFKSAFNR